MKKIYYYLIGILLLITSFIFDKEILIFLTSNRLELLNYTAVFFHNVQGYMLFIFIFIILLLMKQKDKLLPLILSFLIYAVLTTLLKNIVGRARPIDFELNNLETDKINIYTSFPSGHATASATIIPFFNFNKKLYYAWFLIAIIISLSRVYLGVHYLSDVIAGFMLGNFIGDASIYLVNKYKNYKKFTHRKV